MKTTKKIFSLVLCLMLVFSLAATAFASEVHTHTITIINQNPGYTYKAYQIFAGDLGHDGVLSNITWGSGVDGDALLAELKTLDAYKDCTNAKQVAAELADNSAMDDPDAVAFADIVAKHLVGNGVQATWNAETNHYYINGLDDGYYIVVNTAVPDEPNTTYSRHIMEVVRDITVTHKGTFPTSTKTTFEAEVEVKANQSPIGGSVKYEITGTLPGNIGYYTTYYYAFHDTLSKGLTFDKNTANLSVTVNGVDVTEYFWVEANETTETTGEYAGGTDIYVGIQDLLSLEQVNAVGEITADTQVILTYYATVDTDAVIVDAGNPNKAHLEYDNNPNTEGDPNPPSPPPSKPTPPDPTGKTPDDEVRTYVTELTILKKDGAGAALAGAEFTLTGDAVKTMIVTNREFQEAEAGETATHWELKDGTFTDVAPTFDEDTIDDVDNSTAHGYVKPGTAAEPAGPTHLLVETDEVIEKAENVEVKAFVGPDGYLTFTGLGAGTYTLTESVTPIGFNTIDPITFTVTFDPTTGKFDETTNNLIMIENDNTLYAEIINVAGTVLPSTGGIGTTLFYVIGGLMFAGAAILLVTKKRMSA